MKKGATLESSTRRRARARPSPSSILACEDDDFTRAITQRVLAQNRAELEADTVSDLETASKWTLEDSLKVA